MRYYGPSSWVRYIGHVWLYFSPRFLTNDADRLQFKEIRAFSRSVAGSNPSAANLEIFNGLQRNKAAARLSKIGRRTQAPSGPELRPCVPDMRTCERLVHLYMRLLNPIYQIVHHRSFRVQGRAPRVLEGPGFGGGRLFLQIPSHHGHRNLLLARAWVLAAHQWIAGPFEKNRIDFDFVQVHCLLLLSREIVSVKTPGVTVSSGSLLRAAMQLGMHREPKTLPHGGARPMPQLTPLQAEARRRLWFGVLELGLAVIYGMGFACHDLLRQL